MPGIGGYNINAKAIDNGMNSLGVVCAILGVDLETFRLQVLLDLFQYLCLHVQIYLCISLCTVGSQGFGIHIPGGSSGIDCICVYEPPTAHMTLPFQCSTLWMQLFLNSTLNGISVLPKQMLPLFTTSASGSIIFGIS